jgi:hypothetical protein
MYWDDLVRRWRRENRQPGPHLLVGAAGHVAVLPARRRRGRGRLILAIAGLGALLALAIATGKVHAAPGPPEGTLASTAVTATDNVPAVCASWPR